jgi:hypothetical protein
MGDRDISQLTYDENCELCRRYSSNTTNFGRDPRDIVSKVTKSSSGGVVTRAKIENLLDNFKTDNVLARQN